MLSMLTQSVVPFSDLQFATIRCAKCKAEVTVDLLYERWEKHPDRPDSALPRQCPICDANFDKTVISGMDMIRQAYKILCDQQTATIEFRVRQPDGVQSRQASESKWASTTF